MGSDLNIDIYGFGLANWIFQKGQDLLAKYFPDTDTALVEFSHRTVVETKEINGNIYIDLDRSGIFRDGKDMRRI